MIASFSDTRSHDERWEEPSVSPPQPRLRVVPKRQSKAVLVEDAATLAPLVGALARLAVRDLFPNNGEPGSERQRAEAIDVASEPKRAPEVG